MTLVFYPKSHRYKLDGQWVGGVTTLIKNGLPSDALKYWAARTVAEYVADNPDDVDALRRMGRGPMVHALKEVPWEKRDKAAARGTEVHAIAELLTQGEEVDVPEHLDGYVQSCVEFLDDWQPKTRLRERPCAHRGHQWAGTFDDISELPDGRLVLLDWKTASGIYTKDAFQLAAYRHAEFYVDEDGNEQPMPQVDETWAIHLRTDGYEAIPLKSDTAVYDEFRHIAFVAGAAKRAKGNRTTVGYVGMPLTPPGDQE